MLYASLVESSHRALATPDIVIIGFYFALVFGIGMYFARRERTSEDYFLAGRNVGRSEEHTSELQSRLHLVCRLLLEKKKKEVRYILQTHVIFQVLFLLVDIE